MRRVLRSAVATLVGSAWLFTSLGGLPATGQQPRPYTNRFDNVLKSMPGITARTAIVRDDRGIPHIEAENDADAMFAQGYATASDRLFQMDLLRRTAGGRLSEIFGKATLEQDKLHRTLGLYRIAESVAAGMPAEEKALVEAYAAGVNAWLAGLADDALPIECKILKYRPAPWRPADTIVIGRLFAEDLSTTWDSDLSNAPLRQLSKEDQEMLFPDASPMDVLVVGGESPAKPAPKKGSPAKRRASLVVPSNEIIADAQRRVAELHAALERVGMDAEERAASNNWVVSGKRTATGKPLLANDPHLRPAAPGIWHMVHLTTPTMNVAGVTAPGVPLVLIGHNDRIAWGCTNLAPDVQDLYRETFDPQNPRRYKTPDGWREAEVRTETIRVRKQPLSPETEPVSLDVTVTRHGPIVAERGGERYALKWTAFDPDPVEVGCYRKFATAKNWTDFQNALRDYRGATQNFVYADADGHIGYYGAGRIPIRKNGDGSAPMDGSTDDFEWTGLIPFEELPHVFDPPSGIIVTANSRIAGKNYKHFLTHDWSPPFRARRIYDRLTSIGRKLTADDIGAAQADGYSIGGAEFARALISIGAEIGDDAEWKATLARLQGWNGEVVPDTYAPLLVRDIIETFGRKILRGRFSPEVAGAYAWQARALFFLKVLETKPKEWLPKEYASYAALLKDCNRVVREDLTKRYGADDAKWTWGTAAPARYPHPLAAAPLVGKQFAVEPFPQTGGSRLIPSPNVGANVSMRFIADPGDWNRTRMAIPLGISGDPASPNWLNLLPAWREAKTPAFPFTKEAIKAAAKASLTLVPQTVAAGHARTDRAS